MMIDDDCDSCPNVTQYADNIVVTIVGKHTTEVESNMSVTLDKICKIICSNMIAIN